MKENQKIITFNKESLCSWLCRWAADYGALNGSGNPEDYRAGPIVDDKGNLTGGFYVRTTAEAEFAPMTEAKLAEKETPKLTTQPEVKPAAPAPTTEEKK